ncbi:hypothetical protein PLAN_100002 [Planktothrix rubescens CCAP 1459/22]|uniref:Uncharacterized protein n=1 Tax=Planktothrix rubescens CCAP 1459/22 TaxID=329571 RepID=A0A6J7ZEZ7_PLARU|nr:hypothetical protein PLAN_100002 [Planktothrix rubescens NIVA-CYA 18]
MFPPPLACRARGVWGGCSLLYQAAIANFLLFQDLRKFGDVTLYVGVIHELPLLAFFTVISVGC